MADIVNPQITDAVATTNVKVLAEVPAYAMGIVYQTMSHSLSLVMENASDGQTNMQKVNSAIASAAATKIMQLIGK
ncbi:RebB family R body protein [Aphanothece sacrum]|uniref:RebB-like protein n=1 Tax=Aphanothece sacrum FPU1 TaxID=1920663 RepID=A0A401ILH2_APHSA|nr:RebB family R body protein [Aphanothece sacrum]GBF82095.1 RebB-like protein [Aphanothece sacrum FPU1]GBF85029.1 RebB like protein [Aphanothece sacrum FPU3]